MKEAEVQSTINQLLMDALAIIIKKKNPELAIALRGKRFEDGVPIINKTLGTDIKPDDNGLDITYEVCVGLSRVIAKDATAA